MAITPLPPAPEVTDDTATFNTKAFAWVNAIDEFTTEANALAVDANTDATTATTQAGIATTQAGIATTKAGEASDDADAAAASAVEAAGLVENYQGALASDPSLNKDGGALAAGDWYVNTTSGLIRAYDGSAWVTSVNVTAGVETFSGGSTGLTPSTGTQGDVVLAGTLGVANGGTGLTSPGTSGNVLTSNGTIWESAAPAPSAGTLEATASGTLSDGSTVIVNADGTVSVVADSVVDEPSVGDAVVYESAFAFNASIGFDSNSNRVVIAYSDQGNTGYGTAIVGTVSGTSISFGTAVVFESANSDNFSVTFDTNTNKIVIAYSDEINSGYGTAIVGTVSGTSISFGTAVVFETGDTDYISAIFDNNSNAVVIAYRDGTNSDYGTSVVGTVSGTSISFGSPVVFESAVSLFISASFDSNENKVVIVYSDIPNSQSGTAIVGTVSGTSISFGAAVVFNSGDANENAVVFDSNSNKIVIAYRDVANSNYGTAIVGTVSGTSISFGSEVVFSLTNLDYVFATFDSISNKVVIAYRDIGNSFVGTAIVGEVSGTSISFGTALVYNSASADVSLTFDSNENSVIISYRDSDTFGYARVLKTQAVTTNLTSENYIGISNGAYSDATTATIQIVGAVDDAQSGLTPGQAYYVQIDGSISTTPASPSVFAGTAVSATKLIVKG